MSGYPASIDYREPRHSFAHVDLGQVGLLKVGNPKGHMSH